MHQTLTKIQGEKLGCPQGTKADRFLYPEGQKQSTQPKRSIDNMETV